VFFTQGIHDTTVDDIASAAEVSKGTVYLYFQNKETILAVLLQEGLETLAKVLEEAFGSAETIPAPMRLRRLAQAYFDYFHSNPHYYRLLIQFERKKFQESIDPDLYEQTLLRSTRGLTYVVRALEQGVSEGDFFVQDPKREASVLWAMLHGVYVVLGHPLRREMLAADLESLYGSAVDLAIRGLSAPVFDQTGRGN
jgi:AcrR family transcriptional regulator